MKIEHSEKPQLCKDNDWNLGCRFVITLPQNYQDRLALPVEFCSWLRRVKTDMRLTVTFPLLNQIFTLPIKKSSFGGYYYISKSAWVNIPVLAAVKNNKCLIWFEYHGMMEFEASVMKEKYDLEAGMIGYKEIKLKCAPVRSHGSAATWPNCPSTGASRFNLDGAKWDFRVVLKRHHKRQIPVPKDVCVAANLKKYRYAKLFLLCDDPPNKEWKLRIVKINKGKAGVRFGGQWTKVVDELGLHEGVTCHFYLHPPSTGTGDRGLAVAVDINNGKRHSTEGVGGVGSVSHLICRDLMGKRIQHEIDDVRIKTEHESAHALSPEI